MIISGVYGPNGWAIFVTKRGPRSQDVVCVIDRGSATDGRAPEDANLGACRKAQENALKRFGEQHRGPLTCHDVLVTMLMGV